MNGDIKTLLLLGGSSAQLIAIRKAKELGYRTIVCDYLPDNPGQYIADVFYQVSTTDKEAVLHVAKEEHIDGIVAYGSDPAAPTAAYVSEKMGLPGVPYNIASSFCDKDFFRAFLRENGFNVPGSIALTDPSAPACIDGLLFPLIVKPVDSSGSKGVTVVYSAEDLPQAISLAFSRSRGGKVIVEEFIQRDHPHVIEGEIFVVDGTVESWGLINSIRDEETNPLLPAGYSLPLELDEERASLVRSEISRLIDASGVTYGAFNIEMIIDSYKRLFFLDVGPRNGGNMLPEFITMASGKDVIEATLRAAMGDCDGIDVAFDGMSSGYWGLGVLHALKSGVFKGIAYSEEAQKSLVRQYVNAKPGDKINAFTVCTDLVGLSFFHFDTCEQMDAVMGDAANTMTVLVD